jgi:hypothetical protein
VHHCEGAAPPRSIQEVDRQIARHHAARLDRFDTNTDVGRALRALASRCTPTSSWAHAAAVVAEALAPPALQQAWALAQAQPKRGRPKKDRTQLSADEERLAWGACALRQVLLAWVDTATP